MICSRNPKKENDIIKLEQAQLLGIMQPTFKKVK